MSVSWKKNSSVLIFLNVVLEQFLEFFAYDL